MKSNDRAPARGTRTWNPYGPRPVGDGGPFSTPIAVVLILGILGLMVVTRTREANPELEKFRHNPRVLDAEEKALRYTGDDWHVDRVLPGKGYSLLVLVRPGNRFSINRLCISRKEEFWKSVPAYTKVGIRARSWHNMPIEELRRCAKEGQNSDAFFELFLVP